MNISLTGKFWYFDIVYWVLFSIPQIVCKGKFEEEYKTSTFKTFPLIVSWCQFAHIKKEKQYREWNKSTFICSFIHERIVQTISLKEGLIQRKNAAIPCIQSLAWDECNTSLSDLQCIISPALTRIYWASLFLFISHKHQGISERWYS